MKPEAANLTQLLNQAGAGDPKAAARVMELVYGELRRLASHHMRKEKPGHTLQTTALVHEAYLRLAGPNGVRIQNRGHFYALAGQQMRRVLVDHARASRARKRGSGAVAIELAEVHGAGRRNQEVDVLALDQALGELEELDPRAAQVVELRFFGGYTDREVVEALGVSLATVRRDWDFAKAWLFERLGAAKK
ncbi:MAG: sigma-70 family RNA polymerase sigma factor [Acidobacteria bacterium]|nr:sigma-70 family RNA polymerase sigma factor [Acidobacteriota bacterium]